MVLVEFLTEKFADRHLGLDENAQKELLDALGHSDLDNFISSVVPAEILDSHPPDSLLPECNEIEALEELRLISEKNQIKRSLIGQGYYGTATPAVIQRHVFENPAWYTSYTPYQAEIAQGRLEALFNFQTLISELTGLPIANASLLDEGTASAEAMSLSFAVRKKSTAKKFLVDKEVFPQTLSVLKTRAEPLGIVLEEIDPKQVEITEEVFGLFLQLPGNHGEMWDPTPVISKSHIVDALVTVAIDPLAQVLMQPIAELGADIAVGSSQRLGIPLGFGGPHAAFFATKEIYKRQIPGRLVGESVDCEGNPALRLALQTREQHIRRDKATSNICTAQALLAIISSFYAVYHGPHGLEAISKRIVFFRAELEAFLKDFGYIVEPLSRFDTLAIYCDEAEEIHQSAQLNGFNFRILPFGSPIKEAKGFAVSFDELTTRNELNKVCQILADIKKKNLIKV